MNTAETAVSFFESLNIASNLFMPSSMSFCMSLTFCLLCLCPGGALSFPTTVAVSVRAV